MALPYECWAWVPGFEGLYQVSTRGRVRSVGMWVNSSYGSKQFREGRILKPGRSNNGYLHVTLFRDGKRRTFSVHRLVAMAWIDNPENKPQVNHRDEGKSNDVYNLEWCTSSENINYGTRNKRDAASKSKAVLALDPETGKVVREFASMMEAQRNGFCNSSISECCNGKALSHRGFVWRFKDDYDQENTWTPVKIGMESRVARRSKAVQAINPETGAVVTEFPSAAEAERNGFDHGTISSCCRGEKKRHRGLIWRFKES